MPRTVLITLLIYKVLVNPCSSCQLPTEANPVSICAFCSDVHAGMRLMIHDSNNYNTEQGVYSIDLDFRCDTLENETYDHDDCFDGLKIPGVTAIETGVWRWYILERRLQLGTTCTFTAILKDLWGEKLPGLHTSCSVKRNVSACLVTPGSVCSGRPGDSRCTCDCGQGFTMHDISVGLHCTNVDECSLGTHRCNSESDCVDTEGSYWCNQTSTNHGNGLGNQSVLVPDLSTPSDRPCTTADEATIPRVTTTSTTISAASMPSFISPQSTAIISDNSTIIIARKEEADSKLLVVLTIVAPLILSVLVVGLVAIALKRYFNKSRKTTLKPLHYSEQFDPEYNPVTIDKTTATRKSLESIFNSLHDLDMHIINESNPSIKDQDTESCMSNVTCELEQANQMSDGEQSSICSQVLDGTTIEPQSITVDKATINKHKHIATYHQPMNVSTFYQSSDSGYIQLDRGINCGRTSTQKETLNTQYHHAVNNLPLFIDHAPQPFNRLNSLSSGYASDSPMTPLELGYCQNHTLQPTESHGIDPGDALTFQWKVGLHLKGSPCQPHHNDSSVATPVYFEFPQCEKMIDHYY